MEELDLIIGDCSALGNFLDWIEMHQEWAIRGSPRRVSEDPLWGRRFQKCSQRINEKLQFLRKIFLFFCKFLKKIWQVFKNLFDFSRKIRKTAFIGVNGKERSPRLPPEAGEFIKNVGEKSKEICNCKTKIS